MRLGILDGEYNAGISSSERAVFEGTRVESSRCGLRIASSGLISKTGQEAVTDEGISFRVLGCSDASATNAKQQIQSNGGWIGRHLETETENKSKKNEMFWVMADVTFPETRSFVILSPCDRIGCERGGRG